VRHLIRRLLNARKKRPRRHLKKWPSLVLAGLAIVSTWITFFLLTVLNSVRPLIADAITSGEPITPAAIVVITGTTLAFAYLWFFGSLSEVVDGRVVSALVRLAVRGGGREPCES